MACINGCEIPEDLYYLIDKHVWVRPAEDGLVRLGMTPVAYKLLRNTLVAVSLQTGHVGQEVPKGRSIAMVESLKYIGGLPAPFDGVLVRGNAMLDENPGAAADDPYGAGWIAEMRPVDWDTAFGELHTGAEGLAAYQEALDDQGIRCDEED